MGPGEGGMQTTGPIPQKASWVSPAVTADAALRKSTAFCQRLLLPGPHRPSRQSGVECNPGGSVPLTPYRAYSAPCRQR
jgi:hypothetical protein